MEQNSDRIPKKVFKLNMETLPSKIRHIFKSKSIVTSNKESSIPSKTLPIFYYSKYNTAPISKTKSSVLMYQIYKNGWNPINCNTVQNNRADIYYKDTIEVPRPSKTTSLILPSNEYGSKVSKNNSTNNPYLRNTNINFNRICVTAQREMSSTGIIINTKARKVTSKHITSMLSKKYTVRNIIKVVWVQICFFMVNADVYWCRSTENTRKRRIVM